MSIEKVLQFQRFCLAILGSTVAVGAGGYALLASKEFGALLGGYILFSLNVLIISYLAMLIFKVMAAKGESMTRATMLVAIGLGGSKFLLLAGSLYVMMVVYQLPGMMVFVGSMLALVFICGYFVVHYLQYLASPEGAAQ